MKRTILAAAALLLAACATATAGGARDPWSAAEPLGPLQVALLYHQRSSTPAPLALALAWPDLCQARGVEAQGQAVAGAKARLDAEAKRVDATERWQVQVRQPLGPYDLQRHGFQTVLRAGAVIRFDAYAYCFRELRYLLVFRNGGAHALLPLDEEGARRLLRRDPSKSVTIDLMVEPVATQVEDGEPALVVDITRLRASDGTGSLLLDTGAAR
jgi:hypothetical protein